MSAKLKHEKAKRRRPKAGKAVPKNVKFSRILNCVPSSKIQNDWRFGDALTAGVTKGAPPPPSKDLRDDSWWTINDQEDTGSCVGWACADSVVRWHLVKAGRLAKGQLLSPRFPWMAAKESDEWPTPPTTFIESEGTSLKAALDVARNYGAVHDNILPFKSGSLYKGEAKTFFAIAARLKISSYFNLNRDPGSWRHWIANNGPILTRLDIDAAWENADQTDGVLDVYNAGASRGGHAVALVGYTPTHFIVRNSWGKGWGRQGYAFASNNYAAAAFNEAYGVTVN